MTRNQKLNLADLRLESNLNGGTSLQTLMAYADNMRVDETRDGLEFVDDGSHGYLLVPHGHPQYAQAVKQKANTAYNYQLLDGTICLEEDIEASKFESFTRKLTPTV